MSTNKETSAIVDAFLIGIAGGAIVGTMFVAPNALQMLEKPLDLLSGKLDKRQRERELARLRRYMKTQGLVRGDYDHGIELTKKAMKRVQKRRLKDMAIVQPEKWDGKWRLILFDIPETDRVARTNFVTKLKDLGIQLLQQSVWVYPHSCKDELFVAAHYFGVGEWVTYIETDHIDNDTDLRRRFKAIL